MERHAWACLTLNPCAELFSTLVSFSRLTIVLPRRILAFALQHFHERRNLPHIGGCGFFEGHAVACGTLVVQCITLSTVKVG